tara:strand:+ start:1001 stop:1363 length:363 start_codon:yes stop_codon:yes gene_type:complete
MIMAKCRTGQVYNVKLKKCVANAKSKSIEISRRLESLETKTAQRLSSSGRGPYLQANPKVGQKRKGVADPRFNRLRGNRKKDPINTVGKAIDTDKESRRYKKLRDTRLKNAAAKKRKKKK